MKKNHKILFGKIGEFVANSVTKVNSSSEVYEEMRSDEIVFNIIPGMTDQVFPPVQIKIL